MSLIHTLLLRRISSKERYYSNKIFVKQNSQDLEQLLNTKYAKDIAYCLNTSNHNRLNNTAYYEVEFINLAEDDTYKHILIRIGDYPQDYDEYMQLCNSSKIVFSIAPDEITIDELETQFDRILNNDEIISVTAKKTSSGTNETKNECIFLYRYDVDIKARAGSVTGSSDKGLSSAVRNAFNESNREKFPTLSTKGYDKLRECILGILQEKAKNMEKEGDKEDVILVQITTTKS